MKIEIKNLGALKQAEFSLGDLTILCGKNNTGKTYATYALFGFLSYWREAFSIRIHKEVVEQLLSQGTVRLNVKRYSDNASRILSEGCNAYVQQLGKVFAAPNDRFKDTFFQVKLEQKDIRPVQVTNRIMSAANAELFSITKDRDSSDLVITLLVKKESVDFPREIIEKIIGNALKDVIFGHLFPNPFIASAERTGAAIFRKELNFPRNRILERMSQSDKGINPIELLFEVYEDYALPVKTNVEFTRQLEAIAKRKSFISEEHPDVLSDFADIIGGEYAVTQKNELFFVPKANKRAKLTMDESSSAVRSLLDIGFYIRHVAQPGDLFMVDEPELNLHPENQCRVARLFARLVNLGIKVFITTHSDYIVKELNTLIMLNSDKAHLKRIADDNNYRKEELLNASRVRVYVAEESLIKLDGGQRRTKCETLIEADISPELGIEVKSFDTEIDRLNRIQEKIVWGEE